MDENDQSSGMIVAIVAGIAAVLVLAGAAAWFLFGL
jgi:hypothetical protein